MPNLLQNRRLLLANPPRGAVFSGPLDSYTLPNRARSVARRLLSIYTGPLIEVRRSSDSTSMDIGYTADGNLDVAALLTFCGAGDGFLAKVYDQVGAADFIQTSAASQLRIVASGVLDTIGTLSRPAATVSSANAQFMFTAAYAALTGANHTTNGVCVLNSDCPRILATGRSADGDDYKNGGWTDIAVNGALLATYDAGSIASSITLSGNARAYTATRTAAGYSITDSQGNTDSDALAATTPDFTRDMWFTYNYGTTYFVGLGAKIAEDIRWNSVPDLTGWHANQKTYFGLT